MSEAPTLTSAEKAASIRDYQRQTCGSEESYAHPLGLQYTSGMRHVAEVCGAYWLLDVIASWQPTIRRQLSVLKSRNFQVWRLLRNHDGTWTVSAWTDTPGQSHQLIGQEIPDSDFPPELSSFEWYVIDGVALLREEY